jgi:fido (protein-threonine AMPylation protein)
MTPRPLSWFASACGLFLPVLGCEAGGDRAAVSAAEITEADPAVTAYLDGASFASLSLQAKNDVRATLDSARGPRSRRAMVDFFASPSFVSLGSVADPQSCVSAGGVAQTLIAGWLRDASLVADPAADVDVRVAAWVTALGRTLAGASLAGLDPLMAQLGAAVSDAHPAFPSAITCSTTTTTPAPKTTTYAMIESGEGARDGRASLEDLFGRTLVVPPRSLVRDWSNLRARWQSLTARAPLTQKTALRDARRAGSATLVRDAHAARRFDAAIGLTDAMARGAISVDAQAMNVIHSAIADRRPGHLRLAGEDVSMGRGAGRRYLPGAAVVEAVADAFREAARRTADGEEVPAIAATLDRKLISIHPYVDANGRTTRLVTDLLLARAGYPPAIDAGVSSALLWEKRELDRDAHFERITRGMQRAVALLG